MAYPNQLIIQSLMGADPSMVHQAPEPNPVPSIVDAFRSFAQSGDYNPIHLPGTEPKDYLKELAHNPDILAKNIDQASNFNFGGITRLRPTWVSSEGGGGISDILNEGAGKIGKVAHSYNDYLKDLQIINLTSKLDSRSEERRVG